MAELLNLLPLKELLKLETDLRKLEPQGRLLEELPVESTGEGQPLKGTFWAVKDPHAIS